MIKKIIIRNYKGIKSLELDFNNFRTILVGNNGVGKSTIIEALQLALGGDSKIELTLFSFHKSCWSVTDRNVSNLPKIEIEVYFSDIKVPMLTCFLVLFTFIFSHLLTHR